MTPSGLAAVVLVCGVALTVWQDVRALLRDESRRRERKLVVDLAERAEDRAVEAARREAAARGVVEIPDDLVALARGYGDDEWAVDGALGRMRELYTEHGTWEAVRVQITRELHRSAGPELREMLT